MISSSANCTALIRVPVPSLFIPQILPLAGIVSWKSTKILKRVLMKPPLIQMNTRSQAVSSQEGTSEKKIVAIILAGGTGDRFGADVPKQFLSLNGRPILFHTVSKFLTHPRISEVIIASHSSCISETKKLFPNVRIVEGGETRQLSSLEGLLACPSDTDYVLIHDAVRPLITHDVISRCISALEEGNVAVATVIPSHDTLMEVEESSVLRMADRTRIKRAQTPQAFRYDIVRAAHINAETTDSTDNVRPVLRMGYSCAAVAGDSLNIKITTIADLHTAERLAHLTRPKILDNFQFDGQNAIVFGGTSGIGKATADLLESSGATVVRCSRSNCDIRDPEQIGKLYDSVSSIDILVISSGILIPHRIANASIEEINSVIETNFVGPINACRLAVRYMKSGSHIVLVGSSSAYRGRANFATYSSSKAALVNFTQAAAEEFLEYGIRVNIVSPPRTDTRLYRNLNPDADPATLFDPHDAARVIASYCKGPETGCVIDLKLGLKGFGTGSDV